MYLIKSSFIFIQKGISILKVIILAIKITNGRQIQKDENRKLIFKEFVKNGIIN